MEERYIASVDLGTSKMAVCVARIQDQDVQVIYYRETPSQGIRNSYVNNPGKVEDVLRKAISQAQQELKIKIQQVIVGLPRYYVRQETASASMVRTDPDSQISEGEVKTLKSMALEEYPLGDSKNEVIYGAVAQSFSTEDSLNELENEIVGMTAEKLEGNFKVFIGRRRHSSNIDTVFNSMAGGRIWGTLFFLFMVFAAFSTELAVFENILACVRELTGFSRPKGCLACGIGIFLLALTTALGYSVFHFQPFADGSAWLDFWDFIVSTNLLPVGALIFSVFCCYKIGWGWDNFIAEANAGRGLKVRNWMKPIFQYFVPICVAALYVYGLFTFKWK